MKKGIFISIRNSKSFKAFSLFFSIIFLLPNLIPSPVFALTSGPSAPEASGFTPVEQQQLVDPFTGDFSYNIPLLSVGDYPLNISYSSSGVSMDAEASWVGLGWNLNVGAINRTVRGLPDDFSGDPVQRQFNIKDNITVGGSIGADVVGDMELAGYELGEKLKSLKIGGGYSVEIKYNNYTGFSLGQTISASVSAGFGAKKSENSFLGAGAGIAIGSGEDGLDIKPSISFDMKMNYSKGAALGIGANYGLLFNSRQGLKQRTFGVAPFYAYTPPKNNAPKNAVSTRVNLLNGSKTTMFNPITYTPKFEFPFHSSAFTFSFKAGGKIFLSDISGVVTGFYSKQALSTESLARQSFGYLYLQNGQGNSKSLLDFNREKDATYMHGSPNLPPAYLTYDIFSVGAQGIGGTYRAHRNEAGYVFDPKVYNTSESYSLGGEVNVGNIVKAGADVGVVMTTSHTSSWDKNNITLPSLKFQSQPVNSPVRNVIFKKIGQTSKTVSQNFMTNIGESNPVAFNINGLGNELELLLTPAFNSLVKKLTEPVQQNETFQILTVSDVQRAGLYHSSLISNSSKAHHIGQIIVYGDEGKRYVFGLPAYNTYQKEVSFNIDTIANKSAALVSYSAGSDNSTGNQNGLDNFFDATTTPPFAYAYYLTDVLSSDYIDITGDGPSPDDFGNYTKVSYTRAYSDFKWRTPVQADSAQYDPGLYSKDDDDKGHYIYGTKEIWYPETIETKTELAVFHTSPRNDSYEALGENGGKGPRSMLRLDSISLYNYSDKQLSGNQAVPLQRVHFVYDYSLCDGIPNGNLGKLTLKEIYFTHQDTYKGRQSPYKFEYSSQNPSYNMQASDRWGTYKPDTSALPNRIFPYTKQDTITDNYASAWLLDSISLPEGGYIKVEYESDRYNYVQDKQAMAMFNVVAATMVQPANNIDWSNSDRLCTVLQNFPCLIFRLGKSITDSADATEYVRKSIGDLTDENGIAKNLYFNFMVNMDDEQEHFDRVYGFCELDNTSPFGVVQNGGEYFGWLKVKPVTTDNNIVFNSNPISKAAFQFCRLNTPKYAFNQTDIQDIEEDPLQATIDILGNASLIEQLVNFVKGPNQTLRDNGIGHKFIPEHSFIRLHCFDKLGGGARVKTLTYHNSWNIMQPGEDSLSFTDSYEYLLEDGLTSSGVAVYEPLLGGDEIPLHLPVTYSPETDKPRWSKMLVPDDQYMAIKPYGEMAFPSPSVGYSRVVVQRKVPDNSTAAGTGYSIFNFHTAKDFPIQTKQTPINPQRRKKKPFFSFIKKEMHDYLYVTQGYAVELNDMHGRIYSSEIFDAHDNLISKTESEYSLGGGIKVLRENGSIEEQNLNTEIDFTVDFREQETETESFSVHGNIGTFSIPPILPLVTIPYAAPAIMKEKTRFRSAVATKVINRYAMLTKQTITDLGARVTTDNLVYDPVTGTPVLTRTNNAFNDILYNFTYPAHVIYPGMQTASLNTGYICSLITDGNGKITSSPNFIYPGDELINRTSTQRLWVYKHGSDLYLINRNGNLSVNTSSTFFIIRSGHRNILAQNAGSVTTLSNPIIQPSPSSWQLDLNVSKKILNSDALTFRDYWHKPEKHLINKDTLPCATYDPDNDGSDTFPCDEDDDTTTTIIVINGWEQFPTSMFPVHGITAPHIYMSTADCMCFLTDSIQRLLDLLVNSIESNVFLDNNPYSLWHTQVVNDSIMEGIVCEDILTNCNTCFRFKIPPPSSKYLDALQLFLDKPNGTNPLIHVLPLDTFMDCNDTVSNEFILRIIRTFYSGTESFTMPVTSLCGDVFTCISYTSLNPEETDFSGCGCPLNIIINPYQSGILGNWRPFESYKFLTPRNPASTAAATNLRTDGYYASFFPFWNYSSNTWHGDTVKWTRANRTTIYAPTGNALENKDALGNYSSALFGYNGQLPIATCSNAQFKEMGYDGFEDYYNKGIPYGIRNFAQLCFNYFHLKFEDYTDALTPLESHTGLYSLGIDNSCNEVSITAEITPPLCEMNACTCPASSVPYVLNSCNMLPLFSPNSGKEKKYLISIWAKEGTSQTALPQTGVPPFELSIEILDPSNRQIGPTQITWQFNPPVLTYASLDIEGWRQFTYQFTLPPLPAGLHLKTTIKKLTSNPVFIDDFRIHPIDANMQSFVYNPFNHRLMATLDENNFAVFYQYDNKGNLQTIRRETERGIMTVSYNIIEQKLK